MLSHNPSRVVQQLLIDRQQASEPSLNSSHPVYTTKERDRPDEVITIYDTESEDISPGNDMFHSVDVQQPNIQIRLRSFDSSGKKLREIQENLLSALNVSVDVEDSTYLVKVLHRTSGPTHLGSTVEVPSGLFIHTINYSISLEEI